MSRPATRAGLYSSRRLGPHELPLPSVPWEGGPAYYSVARNGEKMAKAEARGWSNPNFFPILVWLSDPNHASALAALGINTYFGMFANPGSINTAAAAGMSVIAQANEWSPAEVQAETSGRDNVVAWIPIDEPDLNIAHSAYMSQVSGLKALNDGRMIITNFAHGIRRTVYWSASTGGGFTQMHDAMAENDAACVDQYCYTSPGIRGDPGPQGIVDNFNYPSLHNGTSYLWPGAYQDYAKANQAAAYGWQAKALRSFYEDKGLQRPVWVTVETQMPYLTEANRDIILYAEIKGAVWSAIVNEARGIMYFQHNGFYGEPGTTTPGSYPEIDPNTGAAVDNSTMSLVDGPPGLAAAVLAINTQIQSLAPVLNSQSFVFNFGATGIETMLKGRDGFAYIFATKSVMGTTGSKTFTLTGSGITGTNVEVVGEARNLTVSGGQFSDTFANEYSVHIYKIAF